MGYVIAAILVLLIVAAGVAFFVLGAARREPAIVTPDDRTPVGDTDQHADVPEEGHGGSTGTTRGSVPPAGEGGVGGEGESGSPVQPESERLAERER